MKRVLVTGASGVLGSAIARHLEARGDWVVAHGFEKRPVFSDNWQCDLREESEVEAIFAWAKPDAVVHCTGWSQDALLLKTSREIWRQTLEINALTGFLVARESLKTLPRGGQLILISSRVGARGFAGQSAYAASKGAVLGLAQSAAIEGREREIAVNAILPGFAVSPLSLDLKPEILRAREAENQFPDADAAFSLARFCACLLDLTPPPTGQIFSPDCRI